MNNWKDDSYRSHNIFKEDSGLPMSSYASRSTNNGHSYVPGFMDFDPKFAARSAHRVQRSLKRGESSWFTM